MKLNYKKLFFVGLAFLSISMFWQVYDSIIPKILINSFGLNQTWSGVVMAIDNVLALFLLPLFGHLSDKTNTKWGKRTPYIAIGTLCVAVLVTGVALIDGMQNSLLSAANILPVVKGDFIVNGVFNDAAYQAALQVRQSAVWEVTKSNIFYLIGFTGILFLVLFAMGTYRTPAVALMPDVTPKPLRSKANAIINLMGAAGGVTALGLISILAKDFKSYVPLFIALAVLLVVILVIFMVKVKEKDLASELETTLKEYNLEEEKSVVVEDEKLSKPALTSLILILASVIFWFMGYNAATTKFSIYTQHVLGMSFTLPLLIAQGAAIISFVPIGMISSKIGRRKTILIGIVLISSAFILGYFVNGNTTFLMNLVMALAGIGWATINVNSYPMVVEMSKGSNIGKYTGYYYTASMFAQILTPIISGAIMDSLGMKALFPYSAAFCLLSFVTMFFVKHGDSKPIPKMSKLEAFDVED